MQATQFRRAVIDNPALQLRFGQYVQTLVDQIAQTAACLSFHILEERLARWMLMAHDRAHADHFQLTHAMLGSILGVRRSGVTTAAGVLQKKKLIHYSRGNITILDRTGLEHASCGCYRPIET